MNHNLTNKFIQDLCNRADANNMHLIDVVSQVINRDYDAIRLAPSTTKQSPLEPIPFIKEPLL